MRISALLFAISLLCTSGLATAQATLDAAQQLHKEKKYKAAIEAYEQVLKKDQKNLEARLGVAQAALEWGDFETSNFHALKAESQAPKKLEARELVAFSFVGLGHQKRQAGSDPSAQFEEAVRSLKGLIKTKPKASYYEKLAESYYWTNNLAGAGEAYHQAFKMDKKKHTNTYWAMFCFRAAGETDKAHSNIDLAIAASPKYALYRKEKADLYWAAKNYKDAAQNYGLALAVGGLADKDVGLVSQALYTCRANLKDFDGLIADTTAWAKAQPRSDLALWWNGYSYIIAQKHEKALEAWGNVAKKSAKFRPEAYFYRGKSLRQLKRHDEALVELTKAASSQYRFKANDNPILEMQIMMGEAFKSGNFAFGIKIGVDHLLKVVPEHQMVSHLNDLGLFFRDYGNNLERRGEASKARDCYVKSRKYYKDAIDLFQKRGDVSNTQKAQIQNDYGLMFQYHFADNQTAIKNYKIALTYDKGYTDACLNYGRILAQLGKYKEAEAIIKQGRPRADLDALLRRVQSRSKK